MRILLAAVGAILVSSIVAALGLGAAVTAIGAAIGMGCGWLLYGFIENQQESARIALELEQDRKRYELEHQEADEK